MVNKTFIYILNQKIIYIVTVFLLLGNKLYFFIFILDKIVKVNSSSVYNDLSRIVEKKTSRDWSQVFPLMKR